MVQVERRRSRTTSIAGVVTVVLSLGFAFSQMRKGARPPIANIEDNSGASMKPSYIKSWQKEGFRDGSGLLLNIQLAGHGEMTFCHRFRQVLPAPTMSCMGIKGESAKQIKDMREYIATKEQPWKHHDTGHHVGALLKYFRLVMQNYGDNLPSGPLSSTNWEHPQLVSVIIAMHPFERVLAGSVTVNKRFRPAETRSHGDWWMYANQTKKGDEHFHLTNNFNLHMLSDEPECCDGEVTQRVHFEAAQVLLKRFTYILDFACLDKGLEVMASELGIKNLPPATEGVTIRSSRSYRERIGHDDVYEFLLKQNKLDIELYEWSKRELALVKC